MRNVKLDCRIDGIKDDLQESPVVMSVYRVGGNVSVVGDVNGGSEAKNGVSFFVANSNWKMGIQVNGDGEARYGDDLEAFRRAFRVADGKLDQINKAMSHHGYPDLESVGEMTCNGLLKLMREERPLEDLLFHLAIRPPRLEAYDLEKLLGYIAWDMRPRFNDKRSTLRAVFGHRVYGPCTWQEHVLGNALLELGITGLEEDVSEKFRAFARPPWQLDDPDFDPDALAMPEV